jgi:hypothetical protein
VQDWVASSVPPSESQPCGLDIPADHLEMPLDHYDIPALIADQGSILQNSISAQNVSDNFSSSN